MNVPAPPPQTSWLGYVPLLALAVTLGGMAINFTGKVNAGELRLEAARVELTATINALDARLTAGEARGGGSSWQSLARGTGSIETDYLNGEIVLLGRELGIPVPANEVLQREANRFARERLRPASMELETLSALIDERAAAGSR